MSTLYKAQVLTTEMHSSIIVESAVVSKRGLMLFN